MMAKAAASTAKPVNPIAINAEGVVIRERDVAATARTRNVTEGTGCGAAGTSGPTSVPTGATLPSSANPQSSSFSADATSVSAGQCSSVTIRVTPFRRAIPTYVAPAALVQPILPPRAP